MGADGPVPTRRLSRAGADRPVERNRRGTRLVLWIGITMYPLFGVLDWLVAPAAWLKVLWCTRAFVTVLTLVMFRLLHALVRALPQQPLGELPDRRLVRHLPDDRGLGGARVALSNT